MKSIGAVFYIAVALGAVVIVSLIVDQDTPAPAAQNVDLPSATKHETATLDSARVAALERRIDELQNRVNLAETAASAQEVSSGPQQQAASEAQSAQPEAMEQRPETPERRAETALRDQEEQDRIYQQQTIAALDEQLATEEYDTDWDSNVKAELDQNLKLDSFNGTRVSNVECKSTLCRVALTHTNAEAETLFFENLGNLPMMKNTRAYYQRETNADGSTSMVLYVAREGKSLPLAKAHAQ